MKRTIVALFLGLTAGMVSAGDLVSDFQQPPMSMRPIIIWQWMNGVVSREGITHDLEAYREAGLGGVQNFQIGGQIQTHLGDSTVLIGNEKWCSLMRHAINECARLGLSFGTHNCPGWSSSAHPSVRPEYSMQRLIWTTAQVRGERKRRTQSISLSRPLETGYYADISILAFPNADAYNPAEVIDLTASFDTLTSSLTWEVPQGDWTILRIGHCSSGKTNASQAPPSGSGLECDKMSREAVDHFWQSYPSLLLQLADTLTGRTFCRLEIDSYEAGPQDWTPLMREEFLSRRHYDLTPWLPSLAGYSLPDSLAKPFKRDWQTTIEELFTEHYYLHMKELTEQTPGMQLLIQPYGAPLNTEMVCERMDHNILLCAEFWTRPSHWGGGSVRKLGDIVRRQGRQYLYGEGFTCWPLTAWQDDPAALKPIADRAFAQGVNMLMLHAGAQNPWLDVKPGMSFGKWGTQFSIGQTWWDNAGKAFFAYLGRCQSLLQRGSDVTGMTDCELSFSNSSDSILWLHRRCEEADIFFVCNQQNTDVRQKVTLSSTGRIPELWNATDGSIREADWEQLDGQTQIALELSPYASTFILLRKPATSTGPGIKFHRQETLDSRNVNPSWTINFPAGWGAPTEIKLDSLISWTEHSDAGIRYFSGTATYHGTIDIDRKFLKNTDNCSFVLDLGEVKNIAEVSVNGMSCGDVVWTAPFQVDVTGMLHKGTNNIEIRITNLWANRMIGDEQEPDDARWSDPLVYTYSPDKPAVGCYLEEIPEWLANHEPRPTRRYTFSDFKFFNPHSSLLRSGLIGPVRILKQNRIEE